MMTTNHILFSVCLFIPLQMGLLSYLLYSQKKDREFSHLTEFWVSMFLSALLMILFRENMSHSVAFAMLGWLWPVRTFQLVAEDISGVILINRWHYFAIGMGAFLTFAMGGYALPFLVFTLPLSLTIGGIGIWISYESYKRTAKENKTPLELVTFILFGLFFLRRISYPFWRLDPRFHSLEFASEVFFLIGFAGTGLPVYIQLLKNRHERFLERTLKERSEKFLGQSKFSELGMMSAGIAHEINNPLAVIQARTTQLLRIYRDPQKQKEMADGLQQILYTSERINRTIQGVREFSHQGEKAPFAEMSLKSIFDDVLAFTGQRMRNHGISLRFYGLENYSVLGNKVQLEQVILNLLNNSFDAIEYLPEKWIEVSCHQKGNLVQMYFKDSGSGIAPEIAARIMEPFFTTKNVGKGTGLGLVLARGIVEKHGGTLEYLPDCPHTTFLLQIPRAHETWGQPMH